MVKYQPQGQKKKKSKNQYSEQQVVPHTEQHQPKQHSKQGYKARYHKYKSYKKSQQDFHKGISNQLDDELHIDQVSFNKDEAASDARRDSKDFGQRKVSCLAMP